MDPAQHPQRPRGLSLKAAADATRASCCTPCRITIQLAGSNLGHQRGGRSWELFGPLSQGSLIPHLQLLGHQTHAKSHEADNTPFRSIRPPSTTVWLRRTVTKRWETLGKWPGSFLFRSPSASRMHSTSRTRRAIVNWPRPVIFLASDWLVWEVVPGGLSMSFCLGTPWRPLMVNGQRNPRQAMSILNGAQRGP